MNEGRQITKEQAEACMRADSQFCVDWIGKTYKMINGLVCYLDAAFIYGWGIDRLWNDDEMWRLNPIARIASDPSNAFGSERELTFEEVGAALFRWETVKVIFPDKDDALIKLVIDRGQLEIHESDDGGKTWGVGFLPDEPWKYTLYKEPTQPEPTTEPLTLEALEARVKALEERS